MPSTQPAARGHLPGDTSRERTLTLMGKLVDSLSQGTPDLEIMSHLLEGPMKPWVGEPAEEVRNPDELSVKGFEVLQDSRILDLRAWNPTGAGNLDQTS